MVVGWTPPEDKNQDGIIFRPTSVGGGSDRDITTTDTSNQPTSILERFKQMSMRQKAVIGAGAGFVALKVME